jgi:pimeloyl-ACP methyl ester carboxylesterase
MKTVRVPRAGVALAVAMAAAVFTATGPAGTPAAAGAPAASAQCNTTREPRQPVILVHGFNSKPTTWNSSTRAAIAAAGQSTCIDVFDYAAASTDWVRDKRIGPALATRIVTLGAASSAGGGTGKVIVVAHSMGGLATRCAAAASCNGGRTGVADHLRELITFGTPNLGSYLDDDAARVAAPLLSATCTLRLNYFDPICREIRALGTSAASRAFHPGSAELKDLPQLPATVPVYALAGQVELYSSFFGLNNVDLGDFGDTIVLEDSATVAAQKVEPLGGDQVINCGKIDITDLFRSAHSCWHGTETNDTRFLGAATNQIMVAEKQDSARASAQLLNATLPANSCQSGDIGWKMPYPLRMRNGAGSDYDPSGKFAGSSVSGAKVLGFADIDGDGRTDAVMDYTCFGSLPEQCCAGRSSNLLFISAFSTGSTAALRRVGGVIHGGASLPGDQYGPADRLIGSASLSGTTLSTTQYIIYPDEYTPAQLGGADPNAPVYVRYQFRKGRWIVV